jgi:hypothetical protein
MQKDRRRVSLDVASTVLIKDPESEGMDPPSRSKCRRLYDSIVFFDFNIL